MNPCSKLANSEYTFRLFSDLQISSSELGTIGSELRYYWSKLEDLDTVLQRLESKL